MSKQNIFVRFDDLKERTKGLEELVNFFVDKKIPVNLGVIPANATKELVDYLNSLKNKHPDLVEIDQHGYEHKRTKRGEFDVDDEDLQKKLKKGSDLMKKYFAGNFSYILTVPWHAHANNLPKIAFQNGFSALSVTRSNKPSVRFVYFLGRLFNRSSVLGFHINYENDKNSILPEVSPNIDFIKSYRNGGVIKPTAEVFNELDSLTDSGNIGFLIHPEYFSNGKQKVIFQTFSNLQKNKSYLFKKISDLIVTDTDITQEEMKKYYDKNEFYFGFIRNKHWEGYFNQPLRHLKKIPREVLKNGFCLEVGSGSGNFLEILSNRHLVNPEKYYALDISLLGLNLHKMGNRIRANAEHLPFKRDSFDVVFSLDTLEHIIHYRKAIEELYRVTKPGGYILIRTQNFGSPFVSFAGNDLTIYKRIVADRDAVSKTTAKDVYEKFKKIGSKAIKFESWSSFNWKIPVLRVFNYIPILGFKGGSCAGLFQKSGNLGLKPIKPQFICPNCGGNLTFLKKGCKCLKCGTGYKKEKKILDLYRE